MLKRKEIIKRKKQQKRKRQLKTLSIWLGILGAGGSGYQLNQTQPTFELVALANTPSEFLKRITKPAARIASKSGLYTSVMLAQAALESAWGKSSLSQAPNYNLFGIKGAFNGQTVVKPTLEDDGSGNYYQIRDGFRRYNNYAESLQDYADLLTGGGDSSSWRYQLYSGAHRRHTQSFRDATRHLTGRYATDTAYGEKLNRIIEQYGLTQYDETYNPKPQQRGGTARPAQGGSADNLYVVKAGDSLYGIAGKLGISIDSLLRSTGLGINDIIHPGQVLTVQGDIKPTERKETVQPVIHTPRQIGSERHRVKTGDTLYHIAQRHGVSVQDLMKQNGLTSALIYPGQTLVVGGSRITTTVQPTNQQREYREEKLSTDGSYSVQSGDTLYGIAQKHGMSINQLKQINGLSSNLIHPGQALVVSRSGENNPVQTPTQTATQSQPATTQTSGYAVQSGDTLYSIASRHGMTVDQLKQANGLTSDTIHPGQSLSVTGASIQTTPTVATHTATSTEVGSTVEVGEGLTSSGSHTVQSGDTLYSIAERNGLDVNQLIEQNGGVIIRPGQVINF